MATFQFRSGAGARREGTQLPGFRWPSHIGGHPTTWRPPLVVLIPFHAAAMARGLWLFLTSSPEVRVFEQLADGVDDGHLLYHLRRGINSRWFRMQVNDPELARRGGAHRAG